MESSISEREESHRVRISPARRMNLNRYDLGNGAIGETNLCRVYRDSYGERLLALQAFRVEDKPIIRLGH